MDIDKAIRALYEEKRRLDALIYSLEEMVRRGDNNPHRTRRRRGRKSMSPEERLMVSERMKKYWAERKRQAQAAQS